MELLCERVALLAANPAEVEGDAAALADGDDDVGIGTTRAHPRSSQNHGTEITTGAGRRLRIAVG